MQRILTNVAILSNAWLWDNSHAQLEAAWYLVSNNTLLFLIYCHLNQYFLNSMNGRLCFYERWVH